MAFNLAQLNLCTVQTLDARKEKDAFHVLRETRGVTKVTMPNDNDE